MKSRLQWHRVTNELVCSFAEAGCANCGGKGFVGDDKPTVCSCAALAFRREYIGTGRVRERRQRIGGRDLTWLEYRDLVAVPA